MSQYQARRSSITSPVPGTYCQYCQRLVPRCGMSVLDSTSQARSQVAECSTRIVTSPAESMLSSLSGSTFYAASVPGIA
eukprot:1287631-Rhodomonas_salina.1